MKKKNGVCFIAMHTDTGMPLFIRNINQKKEIPEVVVISLNSVHSFCQSFSISLVKTYAANQVIFWSSFNANMMLILILNDPHYNGEMDGVVGEDGMMGGIDGMVGGIDGVVGGDDDWLYRRAFILLQRCMILKVGQERLDGSYESVKRALELSLELLDSVLLGVLGGSFSTSSFSLLTLSTSISSSPQHVSFQSKFDEFTTTGKSKLTTAAVFVAGRRVAATKKYTNLPQSIAPIIQFYVCETIHKQSLSSSASRCSENVVFLSELEPTSGLRLLTLDLMEAVVLCVLCPSKPALNHLSDRTETFWLSHLDVLRDMAKMLHHPLPPSVTYNKHLTGYMVTSRSKHTSLICCDIHNHSKQPNHSRGVLLMDFYKDSNNNFFNNNNNNLLALNANMDVDLDIRTTTTSSIAATYACGRDCKLYCMSDCGGYDVWLVFEAAIPVYALKSVSKQFVDSMKEVKWIDL